MEALHTTWMILRKGNRVLLGHKKRGLGMGNINGIGGKVEPGESYEHAAVRETEEEIGVTVTKYEQVGTVIFDELFYKGNRQTNVMHCFVATEWRGEPVETAEIKPEWFEVGEIPYEKMWADGEYWMPQVLDGSKIEARFRMSDDYRVLEHAVYAMPDELIATISDSDFGMDDGDFAAYETRYAARAILMNGKNEVALMNATKCGHFKLPGGGVDKGELVEEALRREVLEEAGYEVEVMRPLGYVVEYRDRFKLKQISYTYFCRATEYVGSNLMEDEIADGFELEWFSDARAAIRAVEKVDMDKLSYAGKFFTARELAFLRAGAKILK